MLTYAVDVILELSDRLIRERSDPVVDKEGMYGETSVDMPRRKAWTSDANEFLNSSRYQLYVLIGAVWCVDKLHDDIPNADVQDIAGEFIGKSHVDPRDLHVRVGFSVKKLCHPVLSVGFVHGNVRTILDPGYDWSGRLDDTEGDAAALVSGLSAQGYDFLARG